MALGKKGVFFTFVAVVFLALLIFSTAIGSNFKLRQTSFATETRIHTMNMFVSDVEKDVERGAYIAGFRALVALVDEVVSTGDYLTDVDTDFNELFFNGTLNGTNSSLLVNNTFTDWMDKTSSEAAKIDLILNFSVNSVSLFQDDPWLIGVDVDLVIKVSDREGISRWSKNKSIKSYIELEGFEDPLYPLGTNGIVENRIRRKAVSYFVNGADVSNLLNHTYEGRYVAFTGAPNFLMRMEGDFGSSEYGIESLVDVDELQSKGILPNQRSIVDHVYFATGANPKKYQVSGAPSWFDLDNNTNMNNSQGHLDLYEVNGLV
jgi:hypothetical protein